MKDVPKEEVRPKGLPQKPSEAGFVGRGETKTQVELLSFCLKASVVDLISTRYGPIAQLARAHD